jgi:hypothetical protein
MMSRKITPEEEAQRREHVDEAINSVALEGLSISDKQIENFNRYIRGEVDLDELGTITEKNYGVEN